MFTYRSAQFRVGSLHALFALFLSLRNQFGRRRNLHANNSLLTILFVWFTDKVRVELFGIIHGENPGEDFDGFCFEHFKEGLLKQLFKDFFNQIF